MLCAITGRGHVLENKGIAASTAFIYAACLNHHVPLVRTAACAGGSSAPALHVLARLPGRPCHPALSRMPANHLASLSWRIECTLFCPPCCLQDADLGECVQQGSDSHPRKQCMLQGRPAASTAMQLRHYRPRRRSAPA